MSTPLLRRLAVLSLGLLGSAGSVLGKDAPTAPPTTELRAHPIGALVRPHPWFLADRGPFPVDPTEVNSRDQPLFGSEVNEDARPVGTVEQVVEAIRASVGEPGAWDAEGTSIWVEGGPDLLFVQAPAALQAEVARQLAAWAGEVCTTQVLDVALFEGDVATARGPGGLPAAVASGALVPIAVARTLPSTHGTGSARDGGRWAFLHDYDVEVACECNVPDPIVGIVPEGVAVRAVVMPSARGRWSVHVQGWWAGPPTFSPRRIQGGRVFGEIHKGPTVPVPPGGDVFEAVVATGEDFRVPLTLVENAWETVPLSGHTVLAVRLHVDRPSLPAEIDGERYGPQAPMPPVGAAVTRAFDVGDLLRPVTSGRGLTPRIEPSNYTPPEAPELPEPWAAVGADSLRSLLERTIPSLLEDDRRVESDGGRLVVRADGPRAEAVGRVLADLRTRRLRTTRVDATVVTLPLASLPEAWGEADGFGTLDLATLLTRRGARVVDRAGLDLRDGQRLASVAGTRRAHVRDYDVEIACTTTIGNPVDGTVFSGVSLDLQADPVLSSPLVSCLVRFDRSALREMRVLKTRFGEIEAPVTRDQCLRGALVLAPGETRLAGLSAWGGEATLLLLSRPPAR